MASAWLGQFDHKGVRPFPHNLPFPRRRAYGTTMRVLTIAGIRRDMKDRVLLSLSPPAGASSGPLPFPGRTPPRTQPLASRGERPRASTAAGPAPGAAAARRVSQPDRIGQAQAPRCCRSRIAPTVFPECRRPHTAD
jgi:hypothetical protein